VADSKKQLDTIADAMVRLSKEPSAMITVEIAKLEPTFSMRPRDKQRVDTFVELLAGRKFNPTSGFLIAYQEAPDQPYHVFNGSHRLAAIIKWNTDTLTPVSTLNCKVYQKFLCFAGQAANVSETRPIQKDFYTLQEQVSFHLLIVFNF
jgi:hypothetical protein